MSGRLFQDVHVVNVGNSSFIATNVDIFNGNPGTDVINLGKYDQALWIIQKGAGATGTATITVESCDDVTPTTATAIAFNYWTCTSGDTWSDMQTATSSGFTTTAGANQVYAIEVNSSELYSTNKYCRLKATETVNDPVYGGITCILGKPRYGGEVKLTAIS